MAGSDPRPDPDAPDGDSDGDPDADHATERARMVADDIVDRGVSDPRVLEAMRSVPRHRFVPERLTAAAHDDNALPIGAGQTISQPYIVAVMAEAAALTPESRVLEIGTGSGYGAAVLATLAAEVWTIERHESLATAARGRLEELGYDNVHVVCADGTRGLPDRAPFDAVVVTAGAADVPPALIDQLADGGRIVMPVGRRGGDQRLRRIRRRGDELVVDDLGAVRFVPLIADR